MFPRPALELLRAVDSQTTLACMHLLQWVWPHEPSLNTSVLICSVHSVLVSSSVLRQLVAVLVRDADFEGHNVR